MKLQSIIDAMEKVKNHLEAYSTRTDLVAVCDLAKKELSVIEGVLQAQQAEIAALEIENRKLINLYCEHMTKLYLQIVFDGLGAEDFKALLNSPLSFQTSRLESKFKTQAHARLKAQNTITNELEYVTACSEAYKEAEKETTSSVNLVSRQIYKSLKTYLQNG